MKIAFFDAKQYDIDSFDVVKGDAKIKYFEKIDSWAIWW